MSSGFEYDRKHKGTLIIQKDVRSIPRAEFDQVVVGFCTDADEAGAATIEVRVAPNGGVVFAYEGAGKLHVDERWYE